MDRTPGQIFDDAWDGLMGRERDKRDIETPSTPEGEKQDIEETSVQERKTLSELVQSDPSKWISYIETAYPNEFSTKIDRLRQLMEKGEERNETEQKEMDEIESELALLYQISTYTETALKEYLPDVSDRIKLTPAFLDYILEARGEELTSITKSLLENDDYGSIEKIIEQTQDINAFDTVFSESLKPLMDFLSSDEFDDTQKKSLYGSFHKVKKLLSGEKPEDILAPQSQPEEKQENPTISDVVEKNPDQVQALGEATKKLPGKVGGMLAGLPALLVQMEESNGFIGGLVAGMIRDFIDKIETGDGFIAKIIAQASGVEPKVLVESFRAQYKDLRSMNFLKKTLATREVGWVTEIANSEKGIDPNRLGSFLKIMYQFEVPHDDPDFWKYILEEDKQTIPDAFSDEAERQAMARKIAVREVVQKEREKNPMAKLTLEQLITQLNSTQEVDIRLAIKDQESKLPKVTEAKEPEEQKEA